MRLTELNSNSVRLAELNSINSVRLRELKSNSVNYGIDKTQLFLRFDHFRFAFVRFACFFCMVTRMVHTLMRILPKNYPKIISINSGLFSPKINQKSEKFFFSQLTSVFQEKHMCTLYSITLK